MHELTLPVRFYGSDHATLTLDPRTTAVMVMDANGPQSPTLLTETIAPVVQAARAVGVRVCYFHEDGYGTGGPADITRDWMRVDGGYDLYEVSTAAAPVTKRLFRVVVNHIVHRSTNPPAGF